MKLWGAVGCLALCCLSLFGQTGFSIGDKVDYDCARPSRPVCSGQVVAIRGNEVQIKWGNMRDQMDIVAASAVRPRPRPESPETIARQNEFRNFIQNNGHLMALRQFAALYKDEYHWPGGSPLNAASWQAVMSRLAEVDSLCKGKYSGLPDPQWAVSFLKPGDVDYRFSEWCRIADQRAALEPRVRAFAAMNFVVMNELSEIGKAIEHSQNRTPDDIQLFIYEPDKWRAANMPKYQATFRNQFGVDVPPEFFAPAEAKAAELKAVIDKTAPTRTFDLPPHRDAAVEALVRARFAAEIPGVQILKIGGSYPTWAKREGLSLVGSGTGYKLYKVEYNFYKRGWVLLRVPNRPYCQAQEWLVGRGNTGIVPVGIGGSGIFMKCQ